MKRGGYIKRKTELKRTGFKRKRGKQLPRKSKRRVEKQGMDKLRQRDSCKLTFMEAQLWLPQAGDATGRKVNWPDPGEVDNRDVLQLFVDLYALQSVKLEDG